MIERMDFPVKWEGDVDAALGVIRTESRSRSELDTVRRELSLRPYPDDGNLWELLDGTDRLLFIETDELLNVCQAVINICSKEDKESPCKKPS